jgi:hypothetical protein
VLQHDITNELGTSTMEHSDEYDGTPINKYEYMYEEHSDECRYDGTTITYMSRANAMCANNTSLRVCAQCFSTE